MIDAEDRNGNAGHPLKRLLLGQLPLERETSMFILVNVIDFFMTYLLLVSGLFREANPIAAHFLNHWGPVKGMLYFKLSLVAFVCVLAQIVALSQLRRGQFILNFGTVAVSAVVIYSLMLYVRHV